MCWQVSKVHHEIYNQQSWDLDKFDDFKSRRRNDGKWIGATIQLSP